MNYYNPYFYTMPNITPKIGLFRRLTGINFGSILNGTQRALNFANQAIPLVKEVKPIINNAKTMFKVMNEFKKNDITAKNVNDETKIDKKNIIKDKNEDSKSNFLNEGPTFFA